MLQTSLGFSIETILVFVILVICAMAIDLFCHCKEKVISLNNAILWSIFWIAIALIFALFLSIKHGMDTANLFITGYVLEKALSIDNLFVIMAIFSWFSVPENYRHRLLYLGVTGAIVFRAVFVVIGTTLFSLGPWMELVFAIIVAFTGIMMLKHADKNERVQDYSKHIAYRFAKKLFPSYPKIVGDHLFITSNMLKQELAKPENKTLVGKFPQKWFYVTPLFLCIVIIELSDLMFAFDSVPAIIAVSHEPLIVYSAMIFAILGLRTLYFVLESMKQYFIHLNKAVICLLFFIALRLALNACYHLFHIGISISTSMSLYIVLVILTIGIVASLIWPKKNGN